MPWTRTPGDDRILEIIVDPHFQGDLLSIAQEHPVWIIDSDDNGPTVETAGDAARSRDLYEICRLGPSSQDPGRDLIDHMPTVHSHFNWSNPRYELVVVKGTPLTDAIKTELEEMYGFTIVQSRSDGFTAKVHPDRTFNVVEFSDLPKKPG